MKMIIDYKNKDEKKVFFLWFG